VCLFVLNHFTPQLQVQISFGVRLYLVKILMMNEYGTWKRLLWSYQYVFLVWNWRVERNSNLSFVTRVMRSKNINEFGLSRPRIIVGHHSNCSFIFSPPCTPSCWSHFERDYCILSYHRVSCCKNMVLAVPSSALDYYYYYYYY